MFARLIATLTVIVSLLFQNFAVMPRRHADDVRLRAVLVSDLHADADPTRDRTDLLRQVLAAVGRNQPDADTLVMAGDLTNSGDLREYVNLLNCLNVWCRVRDRVPAIGNHDSWHHSDDPDYAKAERYFKAFCRWNGVRTDRVYYAKRENGVPFLALGVEVCDFDDPYLSPEQLEWFERELKKACAGDSPVFVITHKPVDDMGAYSGALGEILSRAAAEAKAPVVVVSGHYHDIGENTFRVDADGIVHLNLPSALYTDDGGLGFTVDVTDDAVVFTGMNYLTGEPLAEHIYRVSY